MALHAPVKAYVALGSNMGERTKWLRDALARLDRPDDIAVKAVSRFFDNPAVGGPTDSPPFLNAVAEVETMLGARALLDRLLQIEQDMGRERREKWGPRTIDLDLLLYGNSRNDEPDLIIPHPRMHERAFVLQPLVELAPTLVMPGMKTSVSDLLNRLRAGGAASST